MFPIYNVSEYMFLNAHIKIKFKGKNPKNHSTANI